MIFLVVPIFPAPLIVHVMDKDAPFYTAERNGLEHSTMCAAPVFSVAQ